MPRFDARTAAVSARAMAAFAHLNRLDDLWTLYLSEPGQVSSEQADALTQITAEMRDTLERAGENAERLQGLIGRQRRDIDHAFGLVVRSTLVTAELDSGRRQDIDQVVQAAGGFATFAIGQLDVIRELSRSEADTLEAKMVHIRTHGIAEGDLGDRFKCALLVALLAASIVGLVSTGLILVPALATAIAAGAPPSAIVTLFLAHHGAGFLLDATHGAVGLAHAVEKCFKR